MTSRILGLAVLALAGGLGGCASGAAGGGAGGGGATITVPIDASAPSVAAAQAIADRDCAARGGLAALVSESGNPAAGAPRQAVFSCLEQRRTGGGGNDAR